MKQRGLHILTFDIEEWFHILDNASTKTEREWSRYDSRIHKNMDRIFELLAKHNQKATFFCLGWVAEKYPEVIRKIDELGFEIGSHSHMHQLVYEQSPDEFKSDLERSIKHIEDVIGKKVVSYRSPGFSITEQCTWAFDTMAEMGIEVDCSIFPAARAHGGMRSVSIHEPFLLRRNGHAIQEFPINTVNFAGKRLIYSGGGYFRVLPYPVIKRLVRSSKYVMTYFHPRDFDASQPKIEGLSAKRKLKSYIGLKGATRKLENLLTDFSFTDLATAREVVKWDEASQFELP